MLAAAVPTTLEHVKASDLLRYVRSHGWSRVESLRARGPYEVYSPPQADDLGRNHRIAIPTSEEVKDLRDIAQQIVAISSAIERRDVAAVIDDMLPVAIDTIDVRIVPPKGGSRIPLSAASKIYRSLYSLIDAGEEAETVPKMVARKEAPIDRRGCVWLLPAVPRSFAFRIETVSSIDAQMHLAEGMHGPTPLPTHDAVCRVVRGLQQGQEAVERNGWSGVEPALTVPMCEALMDLHGAVGGHDVEFSHSLSRRFKPPADTDYTGSVRYTSRVAQQIVALKDLLTGSPQIAGPMSAKGTIIELKNKRPQRERDRQLTLVDGACEYDPHKSLVHIRVTERPSNVQVHNLYFSLPENEYREACRAHADGLPVAVAGKLVLTKNKWILSRVESFDVVSRKRRGRKKIAPETAE